MIFGVSTNERTTESGSFDCPYCHTRETYRRVTTDRWFNLFYLPIFPVGREPDQIECQGCFSRVAASASNQPAATQSDPSMGAWDGLDEQGDEGHPFSFGDNQADPMTQENPSVFSDPDVYGEQSAYSGNAYSAHGQQNAYTDSGGYGPSGSYDQSGGYAFAPPVSSVSPLAITSLTISIISFFLIIACGLSFIGSLIAIVTGHIALVQINRSQGTLEGRGLAIGGLITGYSVMLLSFGMIALMYPAFAQAWQKAEQDAAARRQRQALRNVPRPSQYKPPEFNIPKIEIPKIERPPSSFPELDRSNLEPAEFKMPEMPSMPEIPAMPEMPRIELPEFKTPDIPRSQVPRPQIPRPQFPGRAGAPDLSRPPGFERQGFPTDLGVPEIEIPEMPDIPRPGFTPRIGVPRSNARRGAIPDRTVAPGSNVNPALRNNQDAKATGEVQSFSSLGGTVKSIAFSPDGRQLAIGKYGEIRLLDIKSGETLETQKSLREVGDVNHIAFSPDGKSLLAAGFRGNSVTWPINDSVQWNDSFIVSELSRPVEAFSIDSKTLRGISTSQDKAVLFSYESGAHRTRTVGLPWRKTVAIMLLKNGTQAIATDGRELLKIDFVSGDKSQQSLEGKGYPHAAAFTSDGTRLAISRGSKIELIDTKTAKTTHTLERRSVQWTVLFSVDDELLFSGDRGTIHVWNASSGQWKSEINMQSIQYVKTIAVSADGQFLAAIPGSSIETLRVIRIPQ